MDVRKGSIMASALRVVSTDARSIAALPAADRGRRQNAEDLRPGQQKQPKTKRISTRTYDYYRYKLAANTMSRLIFAEASSNLPLSSKLPSAKAADL